LGGQFYAGLDSIIFNNGTVWHLGASGPVVVGVTDLVPLAPVDVVKVFIDNIDPPLG